MVLVAVGSLKGAPGVTSASLALAAVWPRPVVLLEADPAGGDLVYRCRAGDAGTSVDAGGVLKLAVRLRQHGADPESVVAQAQSLACGVDLVQGVVRESQARGVGDLWESIAAAAAVSRVDVVADVGRLSVDSQVLPVTRSASWLVPVATASMESLIHLGAGVMDVLSAVDPRRTGIPRVAPLLVGPDAHAQRDCADLDDLLDRYGVGHARCAPLPWDAKTLQRLHAGESAAGRYGRSLLLRAAARFAASITETTENAEPPEHGGRQDRTAATRGRQPGPLQTRRILTRPPRTGRRRGGRRGSGVDR